MADYTSLKQQAQAIRDEVKIGANTANRVGVALEGIISAVEMENQRATEAENGLDTAKQKKLMRYFEQEDSAGISYEKDETTHVSVQVSPSQAIMEYKHGNHIDRIVVSDTEHINITSSDENGGNLSQVLVKPDEINIRDGKGKGYLNIKGNYTTLSSSQTDTGLRSTVQANDDLLWLMHYPEDKDGVKSGGIGIVISDSKIAFYSELDGYVCPLTIDKDGTIFIANVADNFAAYIKSLEARIADIAELKRKEFKTINGEAVVGKGDIKIKGYSNLTWGSTSDMNKIVSTGIYVISGTRVSQKDNMPIGNIGTNASISATLLVTESPEGETTYRSIIGQTLMLSNAEGHETKIYTRSANKTSYDGGVTYEVTWGEWTVMQGMREVGMTSSYDSYIDNGMYSGVYNNQRGIIETFVLITINDYAVKQQLGQTKAVSQLRYSLNALTQEAEVYSRVGTGEPMNWSDWSSVGGTPVTIINDLTTGGADKALSAEMGKVLGMSVAELEKRVYDLGDFGRSGQAEAEAGKVGIAGDPGIVLIRYTVGNKNGIILQQVGETKTKQVLMWDSTILQRHINFSDSDKTSVSSISSWWKMGATHTSYDVVTRRLHLQDMNGNKLNPSIDAVLPLASEEQDGLMSKDDGIELLTNGNLKLTLKGETREFMPATPSGDPMHYAYVSAGAEYNDSGANKVKDAPWAALADTDEDKKVVHKAGYWYLNGVGDMTNDDIRYSYTNRTLLYDLNKRATCSNNNIIRTIYPAYIGASVSGFGPTKASSFFGCSRLETFLLSDMSIVRKEPDYSLRLSGAYEFHECKALKAIGQVTPTTTDNNRFAGCTSLRYIWVYALKVSINLKDSSLISKLSVKYMIENSAPTTAITITLHADAYARLAEDADIVAALEAKNTALSGTGGSISLVSA